MLNGFGLGELGKQLRIKEMILLLLLYMGLRWHFAFSVNWRACQSFWLYSEVELHGVGFFVHTLLPFFGFRYIIQYNVNQNYLSHACAKFYVPRGHGRVWHGISHVLHRCSVGLTTCANKDTVHLWLRKTVFSGVYFWLDWWIFVCTLCDLFSQCLQSQTKLYGYGIDGKQARFFDFFLKKINWHCCAFFPFSRE